MKRAPSPSVPGPRWVNAKSVELWWADFSDTCPLVLIGHSLKILKEFYDCCARHEIPSALRC